MAAPAPAQDAHRLRTLWLCTLLHAFTHIYQVALIPLYLLIRKDFALASETEATLLVTVMGLAYFLPSYPVGILADRMSRKTLLGLGLLINALGFVALSLAPHYWSALLAVVFAGLGGSFFHPSATGLVASLFPGAPGKALGRVGIGASIGFFFGPLYAGWRGQYSGWRHPVLELGLFGIAAAILFFVMAEEHDPDRHLQRGPSREKIFPNPILWLFFVLAGLLFALRDFAGSGMASLTSLFLQHAQNFNPKETGWALSCIFLASSVSNPLFGHLSDRGRMRWATLVLALASLVVFIFPTVPPTGVPIFLAAYGFFFMASYPMVEAALMESVHDKVRGRVFGIFITLGGLIGNIAHWFVGSSVTRLGANSASAPSYHFLYRLLALFILASILGLVCLHLVRKKERPQQAGASTPILTPDAPLQ